MPTPRSIQTRGASVAALAAAAAGAGLLASLLPGAAAQSAPRTITLVEQEKGATFKHVRNTPGAGRQANSLGDVLVITNPLADASGARIGTLRVTCVTTRGARDFRRSLMTCNGVYALRDGVLTVQGDVPVGGAVTGAVTGGTGAYVGARGSFTSTPTDGGSTDTITLVG